MHTGTIAGSDPFGVPAPAVPETRDRPGNDHHSVRSYFDAFAPAPEWDDLVRWPPDVFALANLVLDHSEAYRFVVAPPAGRNWPRVPDWTAQVRSAARAWSLAGNGERAGQPPPFVRRYWEVVTRYRDTPLTDVRSGEAWAVTEALLTLHATADEACAEVAANGRRAPEGSFEDRAWTMLQERGSLSRLSPARIRVVPKTNFSSGGITIRSMSRYLALSYESVEIRWRGVEPGPPAGRHDYNLVLVPWPLEVSGQDFRPLPPSRLRNMDTDVFGFFEFAPAHSVDPHVVRSILEVALGKAERVDAVVLPEAAAPPQSIPVLEQALAEYGATFLITGVHEPPTSGSFGRNYLHFGVRSAAGWERYEQDKHHRWCLDEGQIRQYHLTRSLDPRKRWWEAIDIRERSLHVIDLGGGVTTIPLVCEDLARLDEVAEIVRKVGPSLVVAVLLDGPQLPTRWSCRYASVLADDPRSAVLTLTPYGMATRSKPSGMARSRVVAHWNSHTDGLVVIELAPRGSAILLTTSVVGETVWTADGRRHEGVPALTLSGVHQLRTRRASAVARARRLRHR
jgi:hypothetical protein